MLKKFLSVLLAVVMTVSLSVCVYADDASSVSSLESTGLDYSGEGPSEIIYIGDHIILFADSVIDFDKDELGCYCFADTTEGTTRIEIMVHLQRKTWWWWSNVYTWEAFSVNDDYCEVFEVPKPGDGTYRLVGTITAYFAGMSETVNVSSEELTKE